ncbi:MAG: amidohydrolase family protein [Actinomycetota bacterium]|nr:amidohydrolase family protein [Actinomycetota bacterium]
MDRLTLISADGHWGGPPALYRDYIAPQYRDELDALTAEDVAWREGSLTQRRFSAETLDLIDADGRIRNGGERGAWELGPRLAELDHEGVAGEVLLAGHQESVLPFFSHVNRAHSPELRSAGAKAYHRHLSDVMAESGGRLFGIAEPGPCLDMNETLAELRWVAEHGFVGVFAPGNIADPTLPDLGDPYFDAFWATCDEAGLAINVHAGFGFPQGGFSNEGLSMMASMVKDFGTDAVLAQSTLSTPDTSEIRIDQFPAEHPFRVALTAPRRILWQLMLAGVFDRHPELHLVFTEIRADWVPATIAILEDHLTRSGVKMSRSPREYFADNVYIAPSSTRRHEVALRHEIGVDRLMFGTDYPHPEGTWPNTQQWIRDAFEGVTEAELRRILGENAAECYRLPMGPLREAAARIGPTAAELLGAPAVDPRMAAQFHSRAGYLRPPEQADAAALTEMIDTDLAALAGSRPKGNL